MKKKEPEQAVVKEVALTEEQELARIYEQLKALEERRKELFAVKAKRKADECKLLCECVEKIEKLSTGNWLVTVEESGDVVIYPKSSDLPRASSHGSGAARTSTSGPTEIVRKYKERYDELRRYYTPHGAVKRIAEETGRTYQTIYASLKHHNLL